MRLTTASSVSCTASMASSVFFSDASAELFSAVTSSESARASPATDSARRRPSPPRAAAGSRASGAYPRAAVSIVFRLAWISASAGRPCSGSSRPRDPLDLRFEVGERRRHVLRQPLQPLGDRAHQLAELAVALRRRRRRAELAPKRRRCRSEASLRSSCVRNSPPAEKTRPMSSSFFSSRASRSPAMPPAARLGDLLLQPVEALGGNRRFVEALLQPLEAVLGQRADRGVDRGRRARSGAPDRCCGPSEAQAG